MNWRVIPFAFILMSQLFTICSGGHKRVIIHIPFKVKTIHNKHTAVKNAGDGSRHGDYNVIGYSGDIELGNLHSASDDMIDHSFGEGYGGGHGQQWLKASQNAGKNIYGLGGIKHFGGNFKEFDSFEGGFGGNHANLVDSYFMGQGGIDTRFKRR